MHASSEADRPDGPEQVLDERGYLADWTRWTPEFARRLAREDGLELSEAHWEVIEVLREFYGEFEISPPIRSLLRLLREKTGQPGLDSRALYRLFPRGPAKQACRYAGLPRPASCI
jgi:tRNA 2-thiouridine synthesizing protein E